MTHTVLVAGTASHVGKSTIAAGLCRHLARQGVSVAPFKAQNMSNNARVALTPDGDWGEIGVSQFVQARAAGITPTTDVNPVLLKPNGDGESQLVLQGEAVGYIGLETTTENGTGPRAVDPTADGTCMGNSTESSTENSRDGYWEQAREAAINSYERIATNHDVIVAEGAGSIAEINRYDRDLANIETVRFADASILLVADIERGGVFASIYGTLALLPDGIRERVVGTLITKHHGDKRHLQTGIDELERRTGVPVVGVVPHDDPGLPAEDSVSLPDRGGSQVVGTDGVPDDRPETGVQGPHSRQSGSHSPLDRAANLVAEHVDLAPLGFEND